MTDTATTKKKVYIPDLYLAESAGGKKYGKRVLRAAKIKELAETFASMAASGKDFDLLGFFGEDERDPANVKPTMSLSLVVHEEKPGTTTKPAQVQTPW